jgi:hypothetical protein
LSIVRIFPRAANQVKKATLNGTLIRQTLGVSTLFISYSSGFILAHMMKMAVPLAALVNMEIENHNACPTITYYIYSIKTFGKNNVKGHDCTLKVVTTSC